DRVGSVREEQWRKLTHAALETQGVKLLENVNFQVGDAVLFQISPYEQKLQGTAMGAVGPPVAWSVPHVITKVKDKVIECIPAVSRPIVAARQVPMTRVRKIGSDVPGTLVPVAMKELNISAPNYVPWKQRVATRPALSLNRVAAYPQGLRHDEDVAMD